MKYTVLIFSVLSLILVKHAKALQEDTMDTYKTEINVYDPSYGSSSSRILKSHNGMSYTVNRNKSLYVTVPFGYSLMVSIKYIDLRPNNADMLTLFSVDGKTLPVTYSNSASYRKKQYYPDEDKTYYVSSGNLGVTFYTGPYSSFGYDGFELIYTVQGSWSNCNSRYFYCDNGRCIAKILQCDGHNHCGDRSSETRCKYIDSGYRTGTTVGIAFGSFFLLIAVACGIYIIFRRRNRMETRTVITSHPPPTTNMPSYPPVYPQPGANYPQPPPPYFQGVTNQGYQG